MIKKEKQDLKKYLFWLIIAILLIASYFIIKPYIVALITSFILAFLVKPLYTIFQRKLNNSASAIICVGIIILIVILPIAGITGGIIQQSISILNNPLIQSNLEKISDYSFFTNFNISPDILIPRIVDFFASLVATAATYLPSALLSFLIIVISTYYILIKWDFLSQSLEEFIPFANKKEISKEMSDTTKTLVYGTVLVALIQGIVAALGFSLFNIPGALLIASIIFFAAFIPGIGPIAAWGPVALYYLLTEDYSSTIKVLIVGIIISIGIDTLLRNKILEKKSKINPLIILVGLLGGVPIFGVFGFIIGPLVLVYTIKLIDEAMDHR